MPLIDETTERKQLFLPSSADLPEADKEWVVLDVGPITGKDLLTLDTVTNTITYKFNILCERLVEWSVKDANGDVAEIKPDNIRKLPVDDLIFLIGEFDKKAGIDSDPKGLKITVGS